MNLSGLLGSPRNTRDLIRRSIVILRRFGVSPRRMQNMLTRYLDATEAFGCKPTFPTTAVTLRRHPELVRGMGQRGAEIAVHGYVHIDHKTLSLNQQIEHFQKAIGAFRSCQVEFEGFRGPYLRTNNETLEALGKLDFAYDSSQVVHWNVLDRAVYTERQWSEYSRLLDFYEAQDADRHLSLPRFVNGVMEIPVSIPDDEAIVGRLGIKQEQEIGRIWQTILDKTHDRGELFTVQLHHERVPFCEFALREILRQARQLEPHVWIATLGEIAAWWKERRGFSFHVSPAGDRKWRVEASCTGRATVLFRNGRLDKPVEEWAGGYQRVGARDFVVESPVRPVIGVAEGTSPQAVGFLMDEGFVIETGGKRHEYAVFLDSLRDFDESHEKAVLESVEQSALPLVRFWRWPEGARSAMAVTGDIDSITLIDFAMRVVEVWQQRIRDFRGR